MKHLYAYTGDGQYPHYINVRLNEAGQFVFNVRDDAVIFGEDGEYMNAGDLASITLDLPQVLNLIDGLIQGIDPK